MLKISMRHCGNQNQQEVGKVEKGSEGSYVATVHHFNLYLRSSAYKEERFILARGFRGSSLSLASGPVVMKGAMVGPPG